MCTPSTQVLWSGGRHTSTPYKKLYLKDRKEDSDICCTTKRTAGLVCRYGFQATIWETLECICIEVILCVLYMKEESCFFDIFLRLRDFNQIWEILMKTIWKQNFWHFFPFHKPTVNIIISSLASTVIGTLMGVVTVRINTMIWISISNIQPQARCPRIYQIVINTEGKFDEWYGDTDQGHHNNLGFRVQDCCHLEPTCMTVWL